MKEISLFIYHTSLQNNNKRHYYLDLNLAHESWNKRNLIYGYNRLCETVKWKRYFLFIFLIHF